MSLYEVLLGKKLSNGGGTPTVLIEKTITQNGEYSAAADDADGYSSVTVNVASTGKEIEGNCIIDDMICKGYEISITIPSGVTAIGNSAFYGCAGLRSINIPSGVTAIGNSAFYGCAGLTSINIPSGVTAIDDSTFYGCTGLTSIDIPSGVTAIGNSAFYGCAGLTSINIPSGVTTIRNSTFYGCAGLTSIDIPSGVTAINNTAFRGCTGLRSITCRATNPPTIQNNTFQNVPSNCAIYVPANSVAAYKAANNWSARADYIQAIPTV